MSKTEHTHEFAVDAACECGVMISEYVRELQEQRADLIGALMHCYQLFSNIRNDRTSVAGQWLRNKPDCREGWRVIGAALAKVNGEK